MWAQQLVAPFRFEKVEVAAPKAGVLQPGEVLLRLEATGICGSDLPYFKGGPFPAAALREGRYVIPPGAPLHEVAGEVVASRDPNLGRGARVVGWAASGQWAAEAQLSSERPALIVEAVGHQVGTLRDAVEALAMGGQVYGFGVPDDETYPFPMNLCWPPRSCGAGRRG